MMDRHGREQKAQLTLGRNGGNVAVRRECARSRQNIIRWRTKRDEIFNANEPEAQDQEDENNDTSAGEDNDANFSEGIEKEMHELYCISIVLCHKTTLHLCSNFTLEYPWSSLFGL